MFGKLLKYDFRSMLKQFAFIWPAALLLALVNHFTNSGFDSTSKVGETTAGIAFIVYIAILIAMFVIALIFVIQRFYKGLLGDEGYLMHTLPVRPWQLIGSKLLVAVVTTAVSVVVALLSILLIVPWEQVDMGEMFEFVKLLFKHWNDGVDQAALIFLEAVVLILMAFTLEYLYLYLSMAIGHLFSKNRVAMSVAAFVGINIIDRVVLSPITGRLFGLGYGAEGFLRMTEASYSTFHHMTLMTLLNGLVYCAIYFAGTEYILRKRLNLE